MYAVVDELGNQYGIYTVVERHGTYKPGSTASWTCECNNCGNRVVYSGNALRFDRYGKCKRCGRRV